MTKEREKVLRVQADKLASLLGLNPGTYLDRIMIKNISKAKCGDTMTIKDQKITLTPSAIGLAEVILKKI